MDVKKFLKTLGMIVLSLVLAYYTSLVMLILFNPSGDYLTHELLAIYRIVSFYGILIILLINSKNHNS